MAAKSEDASTSDVGNAYWYNLGSSTDVDYYQDTKQKISTSFVRRLGDNQVRVQGTISYNSVSGSAASGYTRLHVTVYDIEGSTSRTTYGTQSGVGSTTVDFTLDISDFTQNGIVRVDVELELFIGTTTSGTGVYEGRMYDDFNAFTET